MQPRFRTSRMLQTEEKTAGIMNALQEMQGKEAKMQKQIKKAEAAQAAAEEASQAAQDYAVQLEQHIQECDNSRRVVGRLMVRRLTLHINELSAAGEQDKVRQC